MLIWEIVIAFLVFGFEGAFYSQKEKNRRSYLSKEWVNAIIFGFLGLIDFLVNNALCLLHSESMCMNSAITVHTHYKKKKKRKKKKKKET